MAYIYKTTYHYKCGTRTTAYVNSHRAKRKLCVPCFYYQEANQCTSIQT